MPDKCNFCGVNKICRIDSAKRSDCKLEFGYRPVGILALHQLESMRSVNRGWQKFLQQMDRRDIIAWNEMHKHCSPATNTCPLDQYIHNPGQLNLKFDSQDNSGNFQD
jgi:hypothetical protein